MRIHVYKQDRSTQDHIFSRVEHQQTKIKESSLTSKSEMEI